MRNQRSLIWLLILVLAFSISACGSPPSTPRTTRSPTSTPRPSLTREPDPTVQACFNLVGLNVRAGPGVEHKDIGGLTSGQCVTLDGRNTDGSWARIRSSDSANAPRGGWVSTGYLDFSGDVLDLPVVGLGVIVVSPVPDTPVPTPPPPPDGPTAICNDGWVSYSQHRRGTCSHHGGVREWLRDDIPP